MVAVDLAANQSVTTTPSKPHCSRSTSVSSQRFSQANVPFTRL